MLHAKGIHKSYKIGPSQLRVLRGVTLSASPGEFLVIMGSSGSGKSTLLHLLGALDIPDRGSVEFAGRSVFDMPTTMRETFRNREVGFVFQFYHLLPELTVLENVLLPALVKHSFVSWFKNRSEAHRAASAMLDRVGLLQRIKHRPKELSGGERQRVAIARALINGPSLLLADEPTGNLDAAMGGDILDLLTELNEDGQTVVMVTHDPVVATRAHRVVRLHDGKIVKPDAAVATVPVA